MFLLDDNGKVLFSSATNSSKTQMLLKEEYIPRILLTVLK